MAVSDPAQQTEQVKTPQFFAIKMGVSDFEASAAFYGAVFGMTFGPEWDAVKVERALNWPEPGHGPNIIMYNHNMLARQGIPPDGGTLDPVNRDIVTGRAPFRAGSSWIVIEVADVNAVAKKLSALGRPAEIMDVGDLGFRFQIVMTTDPDGNVLEIVQPY